MRTLLILIFLSLLLAESCNEIEDCQLNPYSNYVTVDFNIISTKVTQINFDSIALENWSTIATDTTVNFYNLPLDGQDTVARYVFYTDSIDYFLRVSYNTKASVYELGCEASLQYYGLKFETNFDSLNVIGDELNLNAFPTHVEVYF